ncbi:membrane protein insertion efficiency factor YidD [Rhodomicrobium udaipurense]|uniref:Putative membrane protein insertion efficiency factor n=1 Tax=Rhodomicrobium udaipurense TaxID=1202716 RepID=A0A8I1KJY7_9HYPH|nr:membrane protein insertion efficiency factor YidD [Rhodomicrobium udaipurense]MBJ7543429.1 membrane protein insertion efficiency factor YidD [Rhodomicrobium udaipurense]
MELHPAKALKVIAKSPIYVYRYGISPIIGPRCRHLPTCSQYALDAIDVNGAWLGGWLTLGRILRCHPWGSSGYDPAPDLRAEKIPFWAPWRVWRYRRARAAADQVTGC